MSKGQSLGLAFLASAVMAAPAYGQAYGGQGERVVCTRDFNGTMVCPQPQQQQVYIPSGPAQQQPQVVVAEQPNPVVPLIVGTALAVGVAALFSRGSGGGHHHGSYAPVYPPSAYGRVPVPAYHGGSCTPSRLGCVFPDGHTRPYSY